MGTKNDPGAFDCYANAEPDEPMFILLGRDRHAPLLVQLWALLRARDGEDEAKVREALDCADAMSRFAIARGKAPECEPDHFDEVRYAATTGMHEHPEGYDEACACDECCSYQ